MAQPSALGIGASNVDMLGYLCWYLGQVNDIPSALHPTASETGSAVGAPIQRMLHLPVRRHSGSGNALEPTLARLLGLARFRSPLSFRPGIRPETPDLAHSSSWATGFYI